MDVQCPLLRLQENDLLQKQNELLRSSEAAYQNEAHLVSTADWLTWHDCDMV